MIPSIVPQMPAVRLKMLADASICTNFYKISTQKKKTKNEKKRNKNEIANVMRKRIESQQGKCNKEHRAHGEK